MGQELDYSAILADLEQKKAALEATIGSLRAALSLGTLGPAGDVPASSNGMGNTYGPSTGGGEVPAGAFLGKSIQDATKLYLQIVKKKQTSREIADALKRGGMESTSSNFYGIVYSVLSRACKLPNGEIVKLDHSYWGLAGWYPAGLRSTGAPEKRTAKKKVRRKAKAATPVAEKVATNDTPVKANARALELLRRNPTSHYSSEQVAADIGTGTTVARLILGKLRKAGRVKTSGPDTYTFVPYQLGGEAS